MTGWFVCVVGGEAVGPVSTELLVRGIQSGKVPHDALVCSEAEPRWWCLIDVPDLARALPGPEAFRDADAASRYASRTRLGQGGMGEVDLCTDLWIARDVAFKVMQGAKAREAEARARFVREARIQGQLEHPSIVPVYDLGTRADGSVFFTMKRVKGLTLAAIIDGLRAGDEKIRTSYTRRKLLSAMSQVCQALAFAHSRGVVHRDLKPENLMLGDFGEVYVLDWGVAKVLEDSWAGEPTKRIEAPPSQTQAGELVGTPGYAAPEQIRGDTARVGPKSDVYALGAILFEIIALEPLHRTTTLEVAMASTLSIDGARPSERRSEVPPELDEICARATALSRAKRFKSARELQAELERYLDGERDAERRRELAREHALRAEQAFQLAAQGGEGADERRTQGMRELGAALTLEPSNEEASRTLVRVLLEAPGELSPAAEAALREVDRRDRVEGARVGMLFYLAMSIPAPLVFGIGVRRPILMAVLTLVMGAVTGYFAWMWRSGKADPRYMRWAVALSFIVVGLQAAFFGPLFVAPGAAAATAAIFLVSIRANRFARRSILAAGLASIFVPVLLELTGVLPPSYAVVDGRFVIAPNLVAFSPVASFGFLAFAAALTVVATAVGVGRAVEALVEAERRNFAQAWRLKQILPGVDSA
jgi:eukaryotic-like serine/threonine-protein kinase